MFRNGLIDLLPWCSSIFILVFWVAREPWMVAQTTNLTVKISWTGIKRPDRFHLISLPADHCRATWLLGILGLAILVLCFIFCFVSHIRRIKEILEQYPVQTKRQTIHGLILTAVLCFWLSLISWKTACIPQTDSSSNTPWWWAIVCLLVLTATSTVAAIRKPLGPTYHLLPALPSSELP